MKYLFSLAIAAFLATSQASLAEDFFEDDSFEQETQVFYDPLESFNRKSFVMFKGGSEWVLLPLARGYDTITPNFLQQHISSTFNNLDLPINAINGVLLPHKNITIKTTSTFLANTFFGFAGFFNIHEAYKPRQPSFSLEDIAQYYFQKPLPYLVIPMGFGNIFSLASWWETRELYTIARQNSAVRDAMLTYTLGGIVTTINQNRRQIEDTFNNSLDSYSILRNVYYQSQAGKLQALKTKEKPRTDSPLAYKSLISSEFI